MRSLIDRVHDRIGVCSYGLDILAILGGIGAAVGVTGEIAGPVAGAGVVAAGAGSLAGTGLSIAQATKKVPSPPTVTDAERATEAARRRGILARSSGRQSTIKTGPGGVGSGSLGKSVLGTTGSSPL